MKLKHLVFGGVAVFATTAALAQQKPDDTIKARQATFALVAANVAKIKANIDGDYKKDEVMKSAAVIQAIANAGLGSLFTPGTDKGIGFHETQAKSDLFNPENAKKLSDNINNFNEQANQFAVVANIGDKAAVQAQFGKLRGTCKSCHDNFRVDSTSAPAAAPAK